MDQLRTAKWLADYLNIGIQRVYELCRTDRSFPKIVFGDKQLRFSKSAVDLWLASGGTRSQKEDKIDV